MRKLFVLLLFLIVSLTGVAQKSPYHIRNFKSSEFQGFNQTWQCVQDRNGLIYIASTSAIYVYDGIRWFGIEVRVGAATRQLHYDSIADIIYVGSVSDFGCIERDSVNGLFYYSSFTSQLSPEQSIFTDVWEIYQVGKKVYMQSSERIYVVEDKKVVGTIEPEPGKTFALMFGCQDRLYVRERTVGLMQITGMTMQFVPNSGLLANERLLGIIPYGNDTQILMTGDHGLLRMTGVKSKTPSFSWFTVPGDTFLSTGAVLGCEWISESEIAVSSRMGMMIYNREFKPLVLFNRKAGLANESVSEFFVDREKNIWVTHNDGCSMISYYVPATTYNDQCGFEGTMEVMRFFNNRMYLGTSEGLYISAEESGTDAQVKFYRADSPRTEVWDIFNTGKSFLLATSLGLYEYNGVKSNKISDYYTNECHWIDTGKLVFCAEKGGFSVLSYDGKNWNLHKAYEMPGVEIFRASPPVRSSADSNLITFTSFTRFKTLVKVTFSLSDSIREFREFGEANGINGDYFPVVLHDTVFYVGYFTALRYHADRDKNDSSLCFLPAPDVYNLMHSGHPVLSDHGFNFRLFTEQRSSPATTFFGSENGIVFPVRVLLGELFAGENIQYGFAENRDLLWILNEQELIKFRLDRSIDTTSKFNALICSVTFSGDSLQYIFPDALIVKPYSQNSVKFNFAAPYFTYSSTVQFRYMLEGYDTSWSESSRIAEKEYTNLNEGEYTFKVRAFNAYGQHSTVAEFHFRILAPWYRTVWAYTAYVILFFLTILSAVRFSARRLRKQKEKLEEIVKLRTSEVVEQKQQIEKQKEDLEEAYGGIQDSILYAKRIQHALLPEESEIKNLFPESFVLYEPRDIVSGDFYWFAQRNALRFAICADCTGHGVPGALMSMIGNTILNQIISEDGITDAGKILDELHLRVRKALKQDTGGNTKDGMDIAVCAFDPNSRVIQYAGANRSLWIIRKGVLTEYKANKLGIAGDRQDESEMFAAHTIQAEAGDRIYLTTDGFGDQFGGPKGKKFMVKKLQELLRETALFPADKQRDILHETFMKWKGDLEQVDDVLIIGITIL